MIWTGVAIAGRVGVVESAGRAWAERLSARMDRLSSPAPAHEAGSVDPGEDRYDLGRPAIVTSNKAPGALPDVYTRALVNILKRTVAVVELATEQWTKKKGK